MDDHAPQSPSSHDDFSIVAIDDDDGTVGSLPDDVHPWHAIQNAASVLEILGSSENGLSSDEARHRLEKYGLNRLTPPKKESFFHKLFRHTNHVLIYILFVAAAFSIYFAIDDPSGEGGYSSWAEFGLIVGVIAINVTIGFIQEGKAEKAAEAIKAMLSPKAMVLRDCEKHILGAEQLVPGDIVYLKSGDKVPADVRMIHVTSLQVQESILTGESSPVKKHTEAVGVTAGIGDRKCMGFSGTMVTSGEGIAVVCETGDDAEIGRISKLVSSVEATETNLQKQLRFVGIVLAVCVFVIATATFFLAWKGPSKLSTWQEAFKDAVATAVAIVPEGLPAVVTIVLALGVSHMAKRKAIIRQLPCVETLGSLTVICSDKTGTLTKNEMTTVALQSYTTYMEVSGVGYAPVGSFSANGNDASEEQMEYFKFLLLIGALCNNSNVVHVEREGTGEFLWEALGSPTEAAIIVAAMKAGLHIKEIQDSNPRVSTIPFESAHKFMATVHNFHSGDRVILVKGAADKMIDLCRDQFTDDVVGNISPIDAPFWQNKAKSLGSRGLRVLAVCYAALEDNVNVIDLSPSFVLTRPKFLSLVGLIAILDPPREECISSVAEAHSAGIVVKMITGDHAETALAIGCMLGIAKENGVVHVGREIDAMTEEELKTIVGECNIFARASPENKIRIVQALQANFEITSMTGDGVNDAPALKAANVGVAMGITGTDVSKEAAQMVLADDNFATIVAAVREGRRVWDNLRKILILTLPVNFAQGLVIFFSLCIGGLREVPLTVFQVLYVNMITSVTIGLMLACEPAEKDVMARPPRRTNKRLFGKLILWRILFISTVIIVAVIGVFAWGQTWPKRYPLDQRRGEAFTLLILMEVSYSLNCRFLKTALTRQIFLGNKWVYVSVGTVLILQVLILYTPGISNIVFKVKGIDGYQWLRVLTVTVVFFFFVELEKALVDPFLFPMVKPLLKFLGLISPRYPHEREMKGSQRRDADANFADSICHVRYNMHNFDDGEIQIEEEDL